MREKTEGKMMGMTIFLTLFLFFMPLGSCSSNFNEGKEVLVTNSWQTYIQMTPLCVIDKIPLIFDSNDNAPIDWFVHLYGGKKIEVSTPTDFILKHWKQSKYVVISEKDMELGMIASGIATQLSAPMFYEIPDEKILRDLDVKTIILVGGVSISSGLERINIIKLTSRDDALQYYLDLIGKPEFVVLTNINDRYAFLSSMIAGYHDGFFVFMNGNSSAQKDKLHRTIQTLSPKHLAWVTNPYEVTFDNVQSLYQMCDLDSDEYYDVGVGIITGLSIEDASLLMERSRFYENMGGSWKNKCVEGCVREKTEEKHVKKGELEFVGLYGSKCSEGRYLNAIENAGYAYLWTHGSPDGFRMATGYLDCNSEIPNIYPMIFIGESCDTALINVKNGYAKPQNSIALHMVRKGCVAYVGSVKVGGVSLDFTDYLFSRASLPLGEITRIENIRIISSSNDIYPRAILVGDPLFYAFENELFICAIKQKDDHISLDITDISNIPASKLFVVDVPSNGNIEFATFWKNGRKIDTKTNFILSQIPTDLTADGQKFIAMVNGDCTIKLYSTAPLAAKATRLVEIVYSWQEPILDDLSSNFAGLYIFMYLFPLVILLIAIARKRSSRKEKFKKAILPALLATVIMMVYVTVFLNKEGLEANLATPLFIGTLALLSYCIGSFFNRKWVASVLSFILILFLTVSVTLLVLVRPLPSALYNIELFSFGVAGLSVVFAVATIISTGIPWIFKRLHSR
jgi:hypothetical protein